MEEDFWKKELTRRPMVVITDTGRMIIGMLVAPRGTADGKAKLRFPMEIEYDGVDTRMIPYPFGIEHVIEKSSMVMEMSYLFSVNQTVITPSQQIADNYMGRTVHLRAELYQKATGKRFTVDSTAPLATGTEVEILL